jgi:ATP-dependent exoDNAse (exonuclease V) alpha subunit
MLNSRQLDNVDKICRRFKEPFLPFGGIQVILCGDFFQLPPVDRGGKEGVKFAYFSDAWKEMDLKICYLSEQHRQKDNLMLGALNDIRGRKVTDQTRNLILSRENKNIEGSIKPTKLFTHNIDADVVNQQELAKIKNQPLAYAMRWSGNKQLVAYLKQGCLAPEKLVLKKGAQVMFLRNNFEKGYVNGTLGTVVGFDEESKMPIVKTLQGKEILAGPETWGVDDYGRTLAEITQLPLRLAWAITVHKSQGMSLDAAEIDLSKSFEFGMGYVALSRVRSLSGISLLGMNEIALEVSPEIFELDKKLLEMSIEAEKIVIQ